MKPRRIFLALFLLGFGLLHNNAFKWVPVDDKPWVWNITGALYPIAMLTVIALFADSVFVTLACVLLASFSLQVIGCTVWYMVDPWPIDATTELCSSRLHAPIGMLGLTAALLLIGYLSKRLGNRDD